MLTLLLAGLTDRPIASQLRLSTRTIHRHIHTLMITAGVRTRFQPGWHVARSGWL
ncbi:LuxR C-terminal-related transcriptional regulator [Actinophytocola sp.]|uniref:LuxR C-terminal-related transcriptional regulator n=1 Tax=Actinophytocola sp. TaxID=1872138 RepID=UPI0039C884FB